MKFRTISGNEYWYNPYSNEIEGYDGQTEDLSFISYRPLPNINSLPDLDHFILEVSQNCNLRCSYCCYSGLYKENRAHQDVLMSDSQIPAIIDFIENQRNKENKLTISFYGGEPLLNSSFVRNFVDTSKVVFHHETEYTISTNGILLNEDFIDYAISNDIAIHISLDGMPLLHNKNRCNTFETVAEKLLDIKSKNFEYWFDRVRIFVTISSFDDLQPIAEYWQNSSLLRDKQPISISTIAPNYARESSVAEDDDYSVLLDFLKYYKQNNANIFCRSFFKQFIHGVENRPIFDMTRAVPPMVCLPHNHRCFIDAHYNIGICEKVSDNLRFGSVAGGIDYEEINRVIRETADIRVSRCTDCWACRLCQTCYTNYQQPEIIWDVDCANQRKLIEWKLKIYVELAEHGMIQHCTLSEIMNVDISDIRCIIDDPETKRFLPELCDLTKTDEGIRTFLTTFHHYEETGNGILRGIKAKEKSVESVNPLVGFVAIMDIPDNPTLFYAMHPDYRGQGLMKKAVKDIIEGYKSTFKNINLHTEVHKDNIPSLFLLKSIGFKEENRDKDKIYEVLYL